MTQGFEIVTVSSGSSFPEHSFNANGFPRLFEGDGVYVYNIASQLLVSQAGAAYADFIPASLPIVNAVAQTPTTDIGATNFGTITYLFGMVLSSSGSAMHQLVPETAGNWTNDGGFQGGFTFVDAVGENMGLGAILVGNIAISAASDRVRRSEPTPPPVWSDSDSGLPLTGVGSGTTDLERAEA